MSLPADWLTTILSRPGSGPLRDSQVSRPMMTGCPSVRRLKWRRSSGSDHGSLPFAPMIPLEATAAMT